MYTLHVGNTHLLASHMIQNMKMYSSYVNCSTFSISYSASGAYLVFFQSCACTFIVDNQDNVSLNELAYKEAS